MMDASAKFMMLVHEMVSKVFADSRSSRSPNASSRHGSMTRS